MKNWSKITMLAATALMFTQVHAGPAPTVKFEPPTIKLAEPPAARAGAPAAGAARGAVTTTPTNSRGAVGARQVGTPSAAAQKPAASGQLQLALPPAIKAAPGAKANLKGTAAATAIPSQGAPQCGTSQLSPGSAMAIARANGVVAVSCTQLDASKLTPQQQAKMDKTMANIADLSAKLKDSASSRAAAIELTNKDPYVAKLCAHGCISGAVCDAIEAAGRTASL